MTFDGFAPSINERAFACFETAVRIGGHPIQPFPEDQQGPERARVVRFAPAMFGEQLHGFGSVNADLFQSSAL